MVLRLTCLASAAVVALSAGATAAAQAPATAAPATASKSDDIYLRADVVTEDRIADVLALRRQARQLLRAARETREHLELLATAHRNRALVADEP